MQSDDELLTEIRAVFACERPREFLMNPTHCEECIDHERALQSSDVDRLSLKEIGNPGWDPMCYVTPQAFAYFFPAMARLALDPPDEKGNWIGDQLLFHLGPSNWFCSSFTAQQKQAVCSLLTHLLRTRPALLEEYCCGADEVLRTIANWSGRDSI